MPIKVSQKPVFKDAARRRAGGTLALGDRPHVPAMLRLGCCACSFPNRAHARTLLAQVRLERVGQALKGAQKAVAAAVTGGAVPLLEAPPPDLWPRLAKLLARATQKVSGAVGGAGPSGSRAGVGLPGVTRARERTRICGARALCGGGRRHGRLLCCSCAAGSAGPGPGQPSLPLR